MSKKKLTVTGAVLSLSTAIMFLSHGCLKPFDEINPDWPKETKNKVVRIPFETWPWFMEFSSDSKYFAIWKYDDKGLDNFRDMPCIKVWDIKGKPVPQAIDASKKYISPGYRQLFNWTALRQAPFWETTNPNFAKFTPFPEIAKYSLGWYISSDWQYMIVFTHPEFEKYFKTHEPYEPNLQNIIIEMWKLKPVPTKIWKKPYPSFGKPDYGCFFTEGKTPYILLADFDNVTTYSCQNGEQKYSFSTEDKASEEELKARIKKLGIDTSDSSDAAFSPSKDDFSPEKELLACQDQHSRRFRVFSTKPPFKIIFKGNENEPVRSRGNLCYASGHWSGNTIQFAAKGKYLIVSYQLGTRGLWRPIPNQALTEVYDTSTWKIVWKKNTEQVYKISISDDGKKIALWENGNIEIGDFKPLLR